MASYFARIAGGEAELRFTVNAVCALEDVCGSPEGLADKRFSAVRALLWAGMLGGGQRMSLDEVGTLMEKHLNGGGTLGELNEMCAEALRRAGFSESAE